MGKKRSAKAGAGASIKKGSSTSDGTSQSTVSASGKNTDSEFPSHLVPTKKFPNRTPDVLALHPGAVFVSRNLLDRSECDAWINHAENAVGFESVCHAATRYIAQRECGRIQRSDWSIADALYSRMKYVVDLVARQAEISNADTSYGPIACNGNIRLYKYERGMAFGRHFDGSDEIRHGDINGNTEITVLVYLSSCVGGATRFYPPQSTGNSGGGRQKRKGTKSKAQEEKGGIAFTPEAGSILLHVHGDRCLEHEADPVLQGVKYVLRTDIVYGSTKG